MRVRMMSGTLGCVMALTGVFGFAGATPAGASTGSYRLVRRLSTYIGTIPDSVQREIDTVRSEADLPRLSAAAQKVITTPSIEVVEVGRAPDPRASYATGVGKVGTGCYLVVVSRKRENVLGWVLFSAKTTVRNWCENGIVMTSIPSVQRDSTAHWGWTACGWTNVYTGWLHVRTRYVATGESMFARANACWTPKILKSEAQVRGNGFYTWIA
jgi:hypothetical protein